VPAPLDGLTDAQRQAAEHPAGPLVVLGGAGSGKTRTLEARFARRVREGTRPEAILVLAYSGPAADHLRARLEAVVEAPYEELWVLTFHSWCARLLRDEALAAGLDPFAAAVTPADRLALLLERMDELPLRRHDFQGNPAGLLGSFIERFDRLKEELITPGDYERWALALPAEDGRRERECELAAVYAAHDRILSQAGVLGTGDLVLHAGRLLREDAEVRARVQARFRTVLVDDVQDADRAQMALLSLLAGEARDITVAGDDDQAVHRLRGAGAASIAAFRAEHPAAAVVTLERSLRCPQRVLDAARAVAEPLAGRIPKRLEGPSGGSVAAWRCANERAQAQAAAADIERLLGHHAVRPEAVCVLVRSVRREGQAVALALEERAVPYRVVGSAAFFQRAEVRDVLAWLRLLADPGDAGAVVRALARPPVELRSVDIARCTQISRRRRLDMVSALVAATESPQIPPEARDRILVFLKLYRSAAAALDTTRPDLFVHRLIERLGLRRQQLFAAQADVVERLLNLARFGELAASYVRRSPQATPREFARYITAVADAGLREEEAVGETEPRAVQVMAMRSAKGLEFDHVYVLGLQSERMPGRRRATLEPIPAELVPDGLSKDADEAHEGEMRRVLHVAMTRARRRLVLAYARRSEHGEERDPSPFLEEARAAARVPWEEREEELFGPAETLHATFRMMREELLETVARTGGRLSEMRLDTDLDVSHAIVRYLELLKLAALLERPADQDLADALPEVNARLARAVTAEQREIFQTSALDEYLLDAERDARRRAAAMAAREEPSLEAFLPRRGEGLALSASDVETYRVCPLRYKFARVFRIPQEPTLNQRFGILVHHVLERFHAGGGASTLAELLGLLDAGWRRGGFGDSGEERQLHEKAIHALQRYWHRFQGEDAEPLWFERPFSFRLGPHLVSGRVDRVDRLPDGSYELIDYKTGRPKTRDQLQEDVQLSLYAVGAREAWELEAVRQAYWYVLDDEKVPVECTGADRDWVTETVMEVAEGILAQGFEPTPSFAACSTCDFRIICPAAEK
jgi:DNA helicase-2/ATP-dependent DNA helicase PcrA